MPFRAAYSNNVSIGVIAAFLTCIFWMPLYIAPDYIGDYGTTDLVILRILISTAIMVPFSKNLIKKFSMKSLLIASGLSFLSTTGYYAVLSIAVFNTSTSVAVSVVGLIAVTTLVTENVMKREHNWLLVGSIAGCGFVGSSLFVTDWLQNASMATNSSSQAVLGIFAALAALMFWTAYKIINRLVLNSKVGSAISSRDWSNLTIITAIFSLPAVTVLMWLLTPVVGETIKFPTLGFIWPQFYYLLISALVLATVSTYLAFYAFNFAERNLPQLLSSQIVAPIVPLSVAVDVALGHMQIDLYVIVGIFLVMLSMFSCSLVRQHGFSLKAKA